MMEEELNDEVIPENSGADTIERMKKVLAEEKVRAETYLANWQRAQADFVNYKRRSEQESEERKKFANSVLIMNLLPVLDDFERAFTSIPAKLNKADWVEGISLVQRKLRTVLEAQGLEPIIALGEPFDPHFHEAVRQVDGEEGIIIEEVQKGYKIFNNVIRPSKVVVGNGKINERNDNEDSTML